MNKKYVFILGTLLGVLACFGFLNKNNTKTDKHFVLMEDYCIEGVGYLKKGTIVKYDQGFSEGFTRHLLYLNIPETVITEVYEPKENKEELIIPYWLTQKDSTDCQ